MAKLPEYSTELPEELSGDYSHQLEQFDEILIEANKKGVINNPPNNKEETYDIEKQRIRLQTVASRLYLLGYLRNKISPRRIDKKLEDIREAVFKFQSDANLKTDYWVGNKTWYALDQLVSFESEFQYDQWFINDQIRPEVAQAMHRAIQLRLSCLGLYGSKPNRKFKLLHKVSLAKLGKILRILMIKKSDFKADFNFETLQALFDQDLLTQAIAKSSGRFKNSFPVLLSRADKEIDKKLIQKFIINSAKIELWLLGYKVKIDGIDNFQYPIGGDLWKALRGYYKDYEGKSNSEAKKLANQITPRLFKGLDEAARKVEEYDTDDDASEEVFEALKPKTEEERKSFLSRAWGFLKNKGMRLWDGLKRIWRWIKKIGKKIFSFLQENLFKAFYRFASKAYKIITRGISNVVKSVAVYIKGVLKSDQIVYTFSKDMDCIPYIKSDISSSNLNEGITKLQQHTKAFVLACRIISFGVNFFKTLALGVFGWAKLLFSLVKSYKKIKLLYKDFKLVASY